MNNVFKLPTFLFPSLVNFFMGYVWTGGKNRNKLLSCQRKMDTCGLGEEKGESIVLLLTFKAFKWNVFTITAYKDVIFMCCFRQSTTNWYQSIQLLIHTFIYISIVIENRYQLITTWIFAIDWSSTININWVIDIDCHWLSVSLIGYAIISYTALYYWRLSWIIFKFIFTWESSVYLGLSIFLYNLSFVKRVNIFFPSWKQTLSNLYLA